MPRQVPRDLSHGFGYASIHMLAWPVPPVVLILSNLKLAKMAIPAKLAA